MSRNKNIKVPGWAYYDNPVSTFGIIYADMLKSKQYQNLSCGGKQFLTTCIVNASTEKAKECLYNALKERYALLDEKKTEQDIRSEVYDKNRKYFVFPKCQYEQYGYSKGDSGKYFKELKEKGFIRTKQDGKTNRKVNIYEFITDWKKQ